MKTLVFQPDDLWNRQIILLFMLHTQKCNFPQIIILCVNRKKYGKNNNLKYILNITKKIIVTTKKNYIVHNFPLALYHFRNRK